MLLLSRLISPVLADMAFVLFMLLESALDVFRKKRPNMKKRFSVSFCWIEELVVLLLIFLSQLFGCVAASAFDWLAVVVVCVSEVTFATLHLK